MKWWTDVWLNEGFATYVEDIGKDFYDPELESREIMLVRDFHSVLSADSLESSEPISTQVDNPYYMPFAGFLYYSKGNCLLRMIENFITLETFNKGINRYLSGLAYQNADRDDLWAYLDSAAKEDNTLDSQLTVGQVMETFTGKEL